MDSAKAPGVSAGLGGIPGTIGRSYLAWSYEMLVDFRREFR